MSHCAFPPQYDHSSNCTGSGLLLASLLTGDVRAFFSLLCSQQVSETYSFSYRAEPKARSTALYSMPGSYTELRVQSDSAPPTKAMLVAFPQRNSGEMGQGSQEAGCQAPRFPLHILKSRAKGRTEGIQAAAPAPTSMHWWVMPGSSPRPHFGSVSSLLSPGASNCSNLPALQAKYFLSCL